MVGTDTLFAFDKSELTVAAQVTLIKLSKIIKTYGLAGNTWCNPSRDIGYRLWQEKTDCSKYSS